MTECDKTGEEAHKCEVENDLGESLVIEDQLWIYDSQEEKQKCDEECIRIALEKVMQELKNPVK